MSRPTYCCSGKLTEQRIWGSTQILKLCNCLSTMVFLFINPTIMTSRKPAAYLCMDQCRPTIRGTGGLTAHTYTIRSQLKYLVWPYKWINRLFFVCVNNVCDWTVPITTCSALIVSNKSTLDREYFFWE